MHLIFAQVLSALRTRRASSVTSSNYSGSEPEVAEKSLFHDLNKQRNLFVNSRLLRGLEIVEHAADCLRRRQDDYSREAG